MPKCIVTRRDIIAEPNKDDSDSQAHIIASAFGGTLSPAGILSRKGNNILDRKIDNPHIKAMQPFMNILEGKPDRGGAVGPVIMTDAKGKRYKVSGQNIDALDFEYDVQDVGGEPVGRIKATTRKQAKQLLGKVAKEYGWTQEQLDAQLAAATTVKEHPGPLNRQIFTGPAVEFPSAFTMAALFCANKKLPLPPGFKTYIDSFEEDTEPRPLPPDTFYFMHDVAWYKLHVSMGHCLIFYGDPIRKRAIFFSQLFNLLGVAVTMPFDGTEPVLETYGVDIFEGKEVSVFVNTADLCSLNWTATHTLGPDLFSIFQARSQAVITMAMTRALQRKLEEIFAKHAKVAVAKEAANAMFSDLSELIGLMAPSDQKDAAIAGLKAQLSQVLPLD